MSFRYTLKKLNELWGKNATLKAIGDRRGAERVNELWQAMELLKISKEDWKEIIKAAETIKWQAGAGWTYPEKNPEYVKWSELIKTILTLTQA